MSNYKLVIPSAGIGSRIGQYTKFYNKALVTVGGKPAIARVIDRFPDASEVIVILGYEAEALQCALESLYPDRNIRFIKIDNYEGKGSGLGVTLRSAKKYLQCPFVFSPNDTLIGDVSPKEITAPGNHLVYYESTPDDGYKIDEYRTVSIDEDNCVARLHAKGDGSNLIYTGLCKIQDYASFWKALDNPIADTVGESYGLSALQSVQAHRSEEWFDCGSLSSLRKTKVRFSNPEYNILDKEDEAIWFYDDKVIKFSKSEGFIADRIRRLEYLPKDYFPKIEYFNKYTYRYTLERGSVLSKVLDVQKTKNLLDLMQVKFWTKKACEKRSGELHREIASNFYEKKTLDRVKLYLDKNEFSDRAIVINGVKTSPILDRLAEIDWSALADKVHLGWFHGEFHNENIIYADETFKLIDWRQNFGANNYEFGDVYYDLAKYMHGLLVSHSVVNAGGFKVYWKDEHTASINIDVKFEAQRVKEMFNVWMHDNGYDVTHVQFLTALIFLNIAPLHEQPYSEFLFLLGRLLLEG